MALTSTSLGDLQKAFDSVVDWAERNDLSLNETKTVTMTFRKGGKEGHLTYKGKNLTSVKQFKYLGVTMQTTGTTFTAHIKDRLNKSNERHKASPGDVTANSYETLPAENSTSGDVRTGEYMGSSKLPESARPGKS